MLRIAELKIHRNTEVKHVTIYSVLIKSNDFDTAVTTIRLFSATDLLWMRSNILESVMKFDSFYRRVR